MSSKKATRNPPKSSVVESALAMLLESVQEQNLVSATLHDQRDRDSFQSEIERLDSLAEDRILAAESVLLAARRSAAALLRRRNALVPLHQLPSEVLALILLESLDFENGFNQVALKSLAQVAHRWWEIIKSQPRFWTCVLWPGDDMALSIRKAKTLPLQLFSRQDWLDLGLPWQSISLLQTHADRWFKISIVSDSGYAPQLFTEGLEQSAFPRLEFLKMVGVVGVFHVEICCLERLREAWLSFIPCKGHGPGRTNPAPLLTYLYLQLLPYKPYPISCLASFLRHCPNLQELNILNLSNFEDEAEDDTQGQPPSFIFLPALRSLSIAHTSGDDDGPEVQILGLIRCPSLTNFKMYCYLDPHTEAAVGIGAARVFRALGASSQFEPDALPMSSAVRNSGEAVYFKVVLGNRGFQILAQNRGAPESRPMDIILPMGRRGHITMEDFSRDTLPYLTTFDIPIELATPEQFSQGSSRWADILDRFRNVTALDYRGYPESVKELVEALSQPSSSLPGGGPRAPCLETLVLHDDFSYYAIQTAHPNQMAPHVAAMLKKRRELFISMGMVWPSNFRINLGNDKTFNEDEGGWTKAY
ncbi:hypothetical protein FRC00_004182 [Tulasnella sp. 408]|nr:hypothetical protein FRC00_004182 [Tulasnella sp. 408]